MATTRIYWNEVCVVHLQRTGNALLEEPLPTLARRNLCHRPSDRHSKAAIFKLLSRPMSHRQRHNMRDRFFERLVVIIRLKWLIARGVRKHLSQRTSSLLSVQPRYQFRGGIIQRKLAFIYQGHDGCGCQPLARRCDKDDSVRRICADTALVDNLIFFRDEYSGSGIIASINPVLHSLGYCGEIILWIRVLLTLQDRNEHCERNHEGPTPNEHFGYPYAAPVRFHFAALTEIACPKYLRR